MAHYQYPHQPHPGAAVELDTSGSNRYDGEVFEMPADSAMPKKENEQQEEQHDVRRPVHAQDEELGGMQANPWPFYLDQDVRTEASSRRGDAAESVSVRKPDNEKGEGAEAGAEQPLANPWAYFGPMSPSEDMRGHKAASGHDVGGLGISVEGSGDAKAKSEGQDTPAAAPPPLHHDAQGADGASVPPPATGEPSSSSPPAPAFYPAPLRLARKEVPPAAAPAFKPYAPPTDSVPAVAPLNVKHQRHPSEGRRGESGAALPYRPYRPAGHGAPDKGDGTDTASYSAPVLPPQAAPPQPHGPPVTGALASQGTSPQATSGSPNQTQQQQPASTSDAPLDAIAPHQQPSQPSPPVASGPPPPAAAPPVPPHPPLSPRPPAAAAASVTLPPPPPPSIQEHPPAVPPHPSVPAPSPYPHTPHFIPPVQPVSPYHSPASPSFQRPSTGYPPSSSPVPGLQPYGLPHSAPTSSLPSPDMASYQSQPLSQAQPHNLYPTQAHTPPVASHTPPGPVPSPGPVSYQPPPQHFTPPPPTSSYDIPQPTYASSADIPPPQPPRPQFQQAAMGGYQYYPQPHPQPSPQAQPSSYNYAPGTPSPGAPPSPYHSPYGPAIAPHQHQYPVQPTYATSNGNSPSSPDPQNQYAGPPLPPRPATTQPQLFAGFTSQNVIFFPPPPKRVFSPPPGAAAAAAAAGAAPPPPPRRQSGGSSGRLFSSSSALKWIDKTGKGLEHKLDAVLGSQGSSSKPPPQPPRPT